MRKFQFEGKNNVSGDRIRQLRVLARLSQAELAEFLEDKIIEDRFPPELPLHSSGNGASNSKPQFVKIRYIITYTGATSFSVSSKNTCFTRASTTKKGGSAEAGQKD